MFRHPLAREVAIIVLVKTLIVLAAGLFVFGPAQRLRVDEAGALGRILESRQSLPASPDGNVIGGHP
jgi:regulator of protease activity HflC (stomatin/prohibitin superfamily)